MTRPNQVAGEVGAYLSEQLDAFQKLIDQRDQARGIACDLEGELAHVEQERDQLLLDLNDQSAHISELNATISSLRSSRSGEQVTPE